MLFQFLLLFLVLSLADAHKECNKRWYDQDSFVCVCNSTQDYRSRSVFDCDEPEQLGTLNFKYAVIYSTSKTEDRLKRSEQPFESNRTNDSIQLSIDTGTRYQTILGFGGALTDAVAYFRDHYNINDTALIRQYFGESSIGYTLVRVPIASCDFSLSEYSYLESDQDFELSNLSFATDISKIALLNNLIGEANKTSRGIPKFFASPWSAPGWLKNTAKMRGGGQLRGPFNGIYYLTYGRYLKEFFVHYYSKGIQFWGMTIQNEPSSGLDPNYSFQTMYLSPEQQRDFAQKRLRPLFQTHPATKDLKIMAHDDDRTYVYAAAQKIYKNDNAIDGIAVHWYSNTDDHDSLSLVHHFRPNKFILATEASNADLADEHIPLLGSWNYGERYAHDIIQNLRNWAVGWTDWNLWLNDYGGPNWVGNFLDSPIIINRTIQNGNYEFYKQPMFYVLGHFSMFILPNSSRVKIENESTLPNSIETVAFETSDKNIVLVLFNKDNDSSFEFSIGEKGVNDKSVHVTLEAKSIKTVIWKKTSKLGVNKPKINMKADF